MWKRISIIVCILLFSSVLKAGEKVHLSFEEALSVAFKNNPRVISLNEQIIVYEKKEKEAFSGFLPQLNASIAYKRATANSPGQVGLNLPSSLSSMAGSLNEKRESSDSYNNYSLGVTFNQLVWDFGKVSGQYDSAKYMRNSSEQDLRSNLDNLIISIYQNVLSYILNKELYEAALLYEKQMENHLEMAKAQVASGTRTKIDVLRAQSDLYNAKINTLKMKNSILLSKINIKNLLGIADETDIEIDPPEKENNSELSLGNNFDYIKNRPEYLSYKSRIDSLKALLKSARSGYFPNIYITGGLTYSGYETDNMVYNWNIGAALNWNLFSGFYTEGYYEEIKAQIRMNEALLNQIVKNLYLEIENAKILFDEAKERVNLAASLMKTAEESLSLAEARYKSGLGTFIEVTDAQNVYVNAKNSLIQAEYDLILSGAKLRKALGILNYNKRGE